MNRTTLAALVAAVALGAVASGCAEPAHLSYDFGRAYTSAFQTQADLTRASALDRNYPLSGVEAQSIRLNVQAETTEVKTGESEFEIGE
jgi:hypothetical protein